MCAALHTGTNQYGEVRIMHLVSSKAHSQIMPSLSLIPKSLALFGHKETEIIFTDNLRDRAELERAFPSLRKDVTPPPSDSSLPLLLIPPSHRITALATATSINDNLDVSIMQELELTEGEIFIGFDMEWPVDLESGIHGLVALIQIAYKDQIFLLKVSAYKIKISMAVT